jgi:CheY-like chemotaxis protein
MIFKQQARSKHLRFDFETSGDLPLYIIVDEIKLRRIFVNLLSNAVKFTDEGGIVVRIRADKFNNDTIRFFAEIQDSGSGIAENEKSNLFNHFVQTNAGIRKGSGTGLGLVLCRELAILMGGNITFSSEFGKGSLFSFHVEMKVVKTKTVETHTTKHVKGIDKPDKVYRVLVVDDIKDNLRLSVLMLKLAGFETNEAVNGEDAVLKFMEWTPDLVLMDLRMPVMDGFEATRHIKLTEAGKQTPVIALSAGAFEEDLEKINLSGFHGYIRKPFREMELLRTIGQVLDINYLYEDDASPLQTRYLTNEDALVSDIAKLPESLMLRISDALAVADIKQVTKLINSIDLYNSELAQHLVALANNYDYDHLQKLIKEKETYCE